MSALEIAKMLLCITDDSKDVILSLYIDIATQEILNRTNQSELPAALIYVAAQMAVEMFNEAASASSGTTGAATSISEAGRSVSFDASLAQKLAENKLDERREQINSFRLPYRITKE